MMVIGYTNVVFERDNATSTLVLKIDSSLAMALGEVYCAHRITTAKPCEAHMALAIKSITINSNVPLVTTIDSF